MLPARISPPDPRNGFVLPRCFIVASCSTTPCRVWLRARRSRRGGGESARTNYGEDAAPGNSEGQGEVNCYWMPRGERFDGPHDPLFSCAECSCSYAGRVE